MALQKTITLKSGIVVENAYIRIHIVGGTKELMSINTKSYISQDAYQEGMEYLEIKDYSFVPSVTDSDPNFIKQGYEYLKTLDEFQNAVDC